MGAAFDLYRHPRCVRRLGQLLRREGPHRYFSVKTRGHDSVGVLTVPRNGSDGTRVGGDELLQLKVLQRKDIGGKSRTIRIHVSGSSHYVAVPSLDSGGEKSL